MKTLENIYQNKLGNSYQEITNETTANMILEIHQISFAINFKELYAFTNSVDSIIDHYKECKCSKDRSNKLVIYKAKQTEIRMLLSTNELFLLKDLLIGTDFKLSMDSMLKKFKIS